LGYPQQGLSFRVVKKLPKAADKGIMRDQLVVLKNKDSRANYRKPISNPLHVLEQDLLSAAIIEFCGSAVGGGLALVEVKARNLCVSLDGGIWDLVFDKKFEP
jgi:hypothetical protein